MFMVRGLIKFWINYCVPSLPIKLYQVLKTKDDAKSTCEGDGARLPVIKTDLHRDAMEQFFASLPAYVPGGQG